MRIDRILIIDFLKGLKMYHMIEEAIKLSKQEVNFVQDHSS